MYSSSELTGHSRHTESDPEFRDKSPNNKYDHELNERNDTTSTQSISISSIYDPLWTPSIDSTNRHPEGFTSPQIAMRIRSNDLRLGIDYFKFSAFPEGLRPGTQGEWDRQQVSNADAPVLRLFTKRQILTGHEYWVTYVQPELGDCWVSVMFNPSHASELVGIVESLELAESIWEDLEDLLVLGVSVRDAKISRIDISADFTPVVSFDQVFAQAKGAKPLPQWSQSQTSSVGRRGGETVRHFTKSAGQIYIYDKSAQAKLPEPTLRIEARIENSAKKKFGLVHVGDINSEAVPRAFRALSEPFTQAFEMAPDLDIIYGEHRPRRIAEAIGTLVLENNGVPVAITKNRRTENRRIFRDLGIGSIEDIDGLGYSSN